VNRTERDMIRDSHVTECAQRDYEHRARLFFELEDLYRADGDMQQAGDCHWAGVLSAHAARAEIRDEAPR
jgi:hypothetical protein